MTEAVVVTDPQEIEEPLLQALRAYWESKREGRRMPRRADIDVLELRPLMGNIFLIDVLDGGEEFRFRLLGTELNQRFGRDVTGKTFSEAYRSADPVTGEWLRSVYRRTAEQAVPVWSRAPLRQVARDFIVGTAIHLPLSDDGKNVNMILGATAFSPASR